MKNPRCISVFTKFLYITIRQVFSRQMTFRLSQSSVMASLPEVVVRVRILLTTVHQVHGADGAQLSNAVFCRGQSTAAISSICFCATKELG